MKLVLFKFTDHGSLEKKITKKIEKNFFHLPRHESLQLKK